MIKILFVCHGNICRSPMAEFVMKELVRQAGLEEKIQIASAATSTEEIGNPVYPPAQRKLAEHQISCAGKTARQLRREDYLEYDFLVGMDRANLENMKRMLGGDPEEKLSMLLDYAGRRGEEVADPWYTRDFDATYRDVLAGCRGLLDQIKKSVYKKIKSPSLQAVCLRPGLFGIDSGIKTGELRKIWLCMKICKS